MTLWRGARRPLMLASGVVFALAGWDLYGPRSHSLREFQADDVSELETAMWRSYYAHEQVALFSQLATLLRREYGLPYLRSYRVAYFAARAAVVFQAGHTRADYEKALPDLILFYGAIRRVAHEPFDAERAARLELEWWIIHRERATRPREDLDRSLAALQAELYEMPQEAFLEHARLRAEAMLVRDRAAEEGRMTEETWSEIGRLLLGSWASLWEAVNRRAEDVDKNVDTAR